MNRHNHPEPRAFPRRLLAIAPAAAVLSMAACGGSGAASGTPQERVQTRIDQVVEICQDEDWAKAAGYFTYRGSDRERKYKDTYDASDDRERRSAKRACDALLYEAFPDATASYEFGEYSVEKESEGAWHIQVVKFPEHPNADPLYVAMLEIEGRMVIGDLD